MANETEVKKSEKVKKEKVEKQLNISTAFETLVGKKFVDRKEAAEAIILKLKNANITGNKKGVEFTIERVMTQVSAMLNDIKNGTGPKKWKEYECVKTEKDFCIKKKA